MYFSTVRVSGQLGLGPACPAWFVPRPQRSAEGEVASPWNMELGEGRKLKAGGILT